MKTCPWTQIHLHTPQLPHASPVLTVFPLHLEQLLGNRVWLNSAYQLCSGVGVNNLWYTGGQTEKSNGLFQWITRTAFCWRMSDRGDECPSGALMAVVQNRSALETQPTSFRESKGIVLHFTPPKFWIFHIGHSHTWTRNKSPINYEAHWCTWDFKFFPTS